MSTEAKPLHLSLRELERLYAMADHCRSALRQDYRTTSHVATMLREAIRREMIAVEKQIEAESGRAKQGRPALRVVS